MASIIIRGLDDEVKARLASQAKTHGRSMEAEARTILTNAVSKPHIGIAFLIAAQEAGGGDVIPLPPRKDTARAADLQ